MELHIVNEIKSVEDWYKLYPPAGGAKQWKDGYSAKEFAKAVIEGNFEEELKDKIENISLNDAIFYPERLTYFDDFSSGPRHHDLACICKLNNEKVALCFEAKVKESLDQRLSNAVQDNSKSGKSKKPQRIYNLCKKLFNKKYDSNKMSDIYYQMLTGAMGTLAFAYEQGVSKCFFIVYQLKPSDKKIDETVEKHKQAINAFIKQIDENADITTNSRISLREYKINLDPEKGEKTIELNIVYMEHEFKETNKNN